MMSIQLEPAFILHTRPYRDTSLLVDFFCLHQGRITAVAKSARGSKSRFKGSLTPFSPLLISYTGRGELVTLTQAEQIEPCYVLQGQHLFCGLYLNELLVRLLQRSDPYPTLFHYYQETIRYLQQLHILPEISLRQFEKQLIIELGYGLQLTKDASGNSINPDQFYCYQFERGFVSTEKKPDQIVFYGEHLLSIDKNEFATASVLKEAKRLMRYLLNYLLGNQTLKSRELFLYSNSR